jgi:hypothetical protein
MRRPPRLRNPLLLGSPIVNGIVLGLSSVTIGSVMLATTNRKLLIGAGVCLVLGGMIFLVYSLLCVLRLRRTGVTTAR